MFVYHKSCILHFTALLDERRQKQEKGLTLILSSESFMSVFTFQAGVSKLFGYTRGCSASLSHLYLSSPSQAAAMN